MFVFRPSVLALCVAAAMTLSIAQPLAAAPLRPRAAAASDVIKHIVIVVQENRTVDNLFQTIDMLYPGAGVDTQSYGLTSHHTRQKLAAVSLAAKYDLSHAHFDAGGKGGFVVEYDGGKMDGFDLEKPLCKGGSCASGTAYGYVPMSEALPDLELAHGFAFADHVLQPNEGPSFPGHQYLIAGQSGGFEGKYAESENPTPGTGGCNVSGATIPTIDVTIPYPGASGPPEFPCRTYGAPSTVLEALDAKYPATPNWAYYTPSFTSIWTAPLGVSTIYGNAAERAKVMTPETGIFGAISNGTLRKVSYVIPCGPNSDHPNTGSATGPLWVASIANAIGASPYWKSTAIVVVWDDWGGWYDHYLPPDMRLPRMVPASTGPYLDPYEYGFRVPLFVVSPYVRAAGFVDHTPRDSTSIVNFIHTVFGERPLATLNRYTDDLTPMFDFSRAPLPYNHIDTGNFDPYACAKNQFLEAMPVDDD